VFEDDARAARRATEFTRRMIVENGITYNVYADSQGRDRPWILDPLPYLVTAQEWQTIEAGVAQRARLLNAVLADLYGKQELLAQGALPAELPFGHPNFLWPCMGVRPPGDRWLSIYAADLARSADGQWWVLADRTQAPSGPGYALENRQIVRRAFPELAQSMDVRPLGAFFAALRDELLPQMAGEEPLAVVLTPGSFNETYFEHAYLARALGFPLVEGHDLTVRDETLFLKTLAGLRRVHAVLRRLDDDYCDPVELRVDSALGVPGLLCAIRKGNVAVANALGSGVLESAAWLGFLPPIAEQLIGERLSLPSVASWWCGEAPAFEAVIEQLPRLVIKPAYPNQKLAAIFGRDLDAGERTALIERMRAQPHAFVAQEHLPFSQAPVWYTKNSDAFSGHALGIRVYAIATAQGYRVMPGGLARFASDAHAEIVSMQRGGGSKDIWVLSDSEEAIEESTAPMARADRAPPRHHDLPSTLVENLFWMGRYAERCESKTRLLRATLGLRRNLPFWSQAMDICRQFGASSVFDAEKRFTLNGDIERLGESATRVRGSLSAENWRALTVLQREFRSAEAARSDARETLDQLLLSLAALAGFALDDMTQDDGWRFMMIGRRLERLLFLSDVLARRLNHPATPLRQELEWILEIGDSAITYRTRYRAPPTWNPTVDLLVYDERNPRALAFQWREINTLLIEVAESLGSPPQETLYEAVSGLVALKYTNSGGDLDAEDASRRILANALNALCSAAGQLSEQLTSLHFSHVDLEQRAVSA
jgi:uncharacterized circularly permuted ATP-grasp superfamily protein/uncharacterized alpha-E superfamily protein